MTRAALGVVEEHCKQTRDQPSVVTHVGIYFWTFTASHAARLIVSCSKTMSKTRPPPIPPLRNLFCKGVACQTVSRDPALQSPRPRPVPAPARGSQSPVRLVINPNQAGPQPTPEHVAPQQSNQLPAACDALCCATMQSSSQPVIMRSARHLFETPPPRHKRRPAVVHPRRHGKTCARHERPKPTAAMPYRDLPLCQLVAVVTTSQTALDRLLECRHVVLHQLGSLLVQRVLGVRFEEQEKQPVDDSADVQHRLPVVS